jgi:hypothetical protein
MGRYAPQLSHDIRGRFGNRWRTSATLIWMALASILIVLIFALCALYPTEGSLSRWS